MRWKGSAAVLAMVIALVLGGAGTAHATVADMAEADSSDRRSAVAGAVPSTGGVADAPPTSPQAQQGQYFMPMATSGGCNVDLGTTLREQPDEEGGVSVQVDFSGALSCTPDVYFEGEAYLVDRTAGFDPTILRQGPTISGYDGGTSQDSFYIPANHPAADQIETVFAADLFSPYLWDSCNPRSGQRIIRCDGVGTTHLLAIIGTGPYDSKKRAPATCTAPKIHNWRQTVGTKKNSILADPNGAFEYCVNSAGDVTSARFLGASPRPRISALVGTRGGNPAPQQTTVGGKKVYLSTFEIVYTFNRRYVVEGGAGPIGGKVAYERGESCQISFSFYFSDKPVRDTTVNPCRNWNPGLISMFDVDRPVYRAGDSVAYAVTGAPPNAPIYWSSTKDGVPTGEVDTFYGHYTDANGNWSGPSGPWSESLSGEWVKTVRVGQYFDRIGFTVQPTIDPPVYLAMDVDTYTVGDNFTYAVVGPPNTPIYWSSTKNGVPTGEVDTFYGHYTDANGYFVVTVGPWTADYVGQWTKTVRLGSKTSTFAFTVNN